MKILVKKTLLYYTEKYPVASMQLLIWHNEFSKLSFHNFNVLTTTPKLISHGIGFESTLMPSGKVNYDAWIEGNYEHFLYKKINNQKTNFLYS